LNSALPGEGSREVALHTIKVGFANSQASYSVFFGGTRRHRDSAFTTEQRMFAVLHQTYFKELQKDR
jgi:hypothetical protein